MKRSVLASSAVAVATLLSLVLGTGTVAAATSTGCSNGNWPSTVSGRPTAFHSGAAAGDYVWHDSDGWHLRVTRHADERLVFSGRITSNARLDADPVKLEGADTVAVSADRMTISFRFTNFGAVDGIDFRTACADRLTFSLGIGGHDAPISRILLGSANRHPLENPFVIIRNT